MIRSLTRAILALSLVLPSPGLAATRAAAPVLAGGPAAAWAPVVASLDAQARLAPQAFDPAVLRVLGFSHSQLNLDGAEGLKKLLFVQALPGGLAADPARFSALPAEQQLSWLHAAVGRASSVLESEARSLLVRQGASGLSDEEEKRLIELADLFYYLPEELAGQTRAMAAELRADHVRARSRGILSQLMGFGRSASDDSPEALVRAELGTILTGAAALSRGGLPTGDSVRPASRVEALRPFVASALAAASRRLGERGVKGDGLYRTLLAGHHSVFGAWAETAFGAELRRSGEWTSFVAMATIEAAQAVSLTLDAPGRVFLSRLSPENHFRIKVPSFYGFSATYATVADWLEGSYGRREAPEPKPGLKLFTAFGIPVRADVSFLAILGFLSWQLGSAWFPRVNPGEASSTYLLQGLVSSALLYASVVAHEFGHALMARAFGVKTRQIVLHLLGGVALLDREARKASHEFLIAVAGPMVNVVIAGGLLLALPLAAGAPLVSAVLMYLLAANIIVGIFNMIPAFPMDGGRVLRAGLWGATKDRLKATKAAASLGSLLGTVALGWGLFRFVTGDFSGLIMAMLGFFVRAAAKQASVTPATEIEPDAPPARSEPAARGEKKG